jgi:protein ImuB
MLYLCLRFPLLGLEALSPSLMDQPCALTEAGRKATTVVLCNPPAEATGVRPGQSLATAESLCANLSCYSRQEAKERQHLHNLALWAYRFSSDVSLVAPNALLIELSRSLRLFRGLKPLYRGLLSAYRRRKLSVQAGLANTPLAAELLSHNNYPVGSLLNKQDQLQLQILQQALAALPIEYLPLATTEHEAMRNMGIRRLGELLCLPRAELGQRFEPGLLTLLEKLQGQRDDVRPLFQPAETFSSERQFEGGLQQTEQLRTPISALLQELEIYLRLRQCINRELRWQLQFLDGHKQDWTLPLSHQQFQHRRVLELVMLQLTQQSLPGEVETLRLECHHFAPLPAPDDDLFAGRYSRSAQREKQLAVLSKLRLRLGDDCYHQLTLQNSHLPESNGGVTGDRPQAIPDTQALLPEGLRPSWLLPCPQKLEQYDGQPYWQGPLSLLQGPERLDNQWWQQRQVRDYYIAKHQDGRYCWLYWDCLNRHWYLHGLFG